MLTSILLLASQLSYAQDQSVNETKYANKAYWGSPPEIVLCKSQSKFSKSDVEISASIFKKKEYKKITVRERCNYEYEYGKIKVVDGKQIDTEVYYGLTMLRSYRDAHNKKVLVAVIVHLDTDYTSLSLLKHELGHAFGYQHYDHDQSDIMYSNIVHDH